MALNRSHAELHSVALAPDHALGSQLDSDAVDFGCVRENVVQAARDGQYEMIAIVEAAQGSMEATSGHGPSAVGGLVHCTAECSKPTACNQAADQLLTVHPVRVVVNAKVIASPGVSMLEGRFQCELACGHIVMQPREHVRGTRFSIRAHYSAQRNQCKKEPAHG